MNPELHTLVSQALETASEEGLSQKLLASRSSVGEVALSRLKSADDARFSTLQAIGKGVGLKLVWVADNSLAEHVARGDLFE
ncbi:MAG: hypothetical protein HYZ31_10910 [Gammaproteobacteria bacterium]|nr:hypothetical protein [Gammaproteobacteria bacterium]HEX5637730.1 hypothetical protein [Gammaproteobacteria bacterium]